MTKYPTLRRSLAAAALVALLQPQMAASFELPGVFGQSERPAAAQPIPVPSLPQARVHEESRPVRVAQQSGDVLVRLNQLEEEIRRLNGRVEELSFQLLQAQEDMRKYREDSEFRFQEIEGGGSSSSSGGGERRGEAAPASSASGSDQAAVDDIGQLLDNGLDTSSLETGSGSGGSGDSSTVASVSPNGPGEMYDLAYNYLLAGDYGLAEQAFRQYSQTFPNADDAPDAQYWLGESLFQQQKYNEAAEVFLEAQKGHPDSAKAPEMMLKLGMSLAKLNNRETACVTYKEVSRRYPQMSDNVRRKLGDEQKAASC